MSYMIACHSTIPHFADAEQMNEHRDAHKRWSLGQVFSVLQSRYPERLVAPIQEEVMEHLSCAGQVEKIQWV